MEDEKQLITAAQKRDEAAFSRLYTSYFPVVNRYILQLTMNPSVAEEITQDAMLKAYISLPKFRFESTIQTWFIAIASKTHVDYIRKKKRKRKRDDALQVQFSRRLEWDQAKSPYIWSDYFDQFLGLSPQERMPLLLKFYYDYTYEEIGEMIGMKSGTVKSRIHYTIKKLRKE